VLTQSFLYKLSDLAKSSRFLFFMTILSFGLVQSSQARYVTETLDVTELSVAGFVLNLENIPSQPKKPNFPRKPNPIKPSPKPVCPPWPD
jgi:hypothetical protein